jgi:hypothetical protein
MNRRIWTLLLIVAVSPSAEAVENTLVTEWQELVSSEHGFQVDMPKPFKSSANADHSSLIRQQIKFEGRIGGAVATVTVAHFKPEVFEQTSAQAVFQIVAGSYDLDCGGTLQTKDVNVGRGILRGFYRQCSQPAGTAIKSFLWLVDRRLFHVMVGGREPDVVSADADRVFNSFKLLSQ